jgi:hypothetical protein
MLSRMWQVLLLSFFPHRHGVPAHIMSLHLYIIEDFHDRNLVGILHSKMHMAAVAA